MIRRLGLSLLLCLCCVGCFGDRRRNVKQDVSLERIDHNDKQQHSQKPVEVYLKLSNNPQLFVAKKSEGFLFTTARPASSDRKTCEQCVFRIVCEGPDCAEVCELCGSHASEDSKVKFASVTCSASQDEEKTARTPKKERTHTASPHIKQEDAVTRSYKSAEFNHEDASKMTTSDERIGPARKRINARREFRRKQLAERNKLRFEARKFNSSQGRTETDANNTTPTVPKSSKHNAEHEGKRIANVDKTATKSTLVPKSNDHFKSVEHLKDTSPESHENEVIFSIPKRKNAIVHGEHDVPASKSKDGNEISEDKLSESSKIMKLFEKIVKQKELDKTVKDEKIIHALDRNKDEEHRIHKEKVEPIKIKEKHADMERKEGKTKKPSDESHSHGLKLEDHKIKDSDEFDTDPMLNATLVQSEKEVQAEAWPHVIGKLLQTEIESAHLLIKQKPLKTALKNLKERFKPIFVGAARALAKVFGVHTTDEEQMDAKKEKAEKLKSPLTTLAPPSATKITSKSIDKDTHLSKGQTAVKTDTHRRRDFIYSARMRRRHRPRRPSVNAKLRELESLDKSTASGEDVKSEPDQKGCSCNCFVSRRIGASRSRHRASQRHLDG